MAKGQELITESFIKHNLKYRDDTPWTGKLYFPFPFIDLIDWDGKEYVAVSTKLCNKCPLNEGGQRYNRNFGVACQTIIGLAETNVSFITVDGKTNLPKHASCQKRG